MLSDLVAADIDGRPLELDEILGYCFVMIAGGNDTASGLLAGSAVLLSEHPEQRRRLLADPGLLKGAVEELLRMTSPVQGLSRTTTRHVELHGARIPAGSKVHLLYGSANRDEREVRGDCRPTRRDQIASAACSPSATDPTTASAPPPPGSRPAWRWRSCWRCCPGSRQTAHAADWRPDRSSGGTSRCR